MPVPLLIAIALAFGIEPPPEPGPMSRADLAVRLLEVLGGVVGVTATASALGWALAAGVTRRGRATASLRRAYAIGSKLVEVLALAVFAWTIHDVGWPAVVRSGLGLGDAFLVDEVLILLPFFLAQAAVWWGQSLAEVAMRPAGSALRGGAARQLVRRARQSIGMVLPVVVVFALGQDLLGGRKPWSGENPWAELAVMSGLGAAVLLLSPAFVRLSWPTHPLPEGPLRRRLERLARRHGFRCSDILVWDTDGTLVNAGVTGAAPFFRYVLLSDALIENLDEHQVAAVFGHEIGHIAHRHLFFFGFFFVGSLGMLALLGRGITALTWPGESSAAMVAETALVMAGIAAYFFVLFGMLSRRFERQADVFGCRAVSCDRGDCPPHADRDGQAGVVASRPVDGRLCPVGIRIFANALSEVAALNGIEPRARSWRHGSIARRVAFLEGLEGRPTAVRRFQAGTTRLRLALAAALVGSLVLAVATDSLRFLGR